MIVETIEFFDDEDEELPPPLALKVRCMQLPPSFHLVLKNTVAMNRARKEA